MERYVGKPVTIIGTIKGKNLGEDRLYKHLPVEVAGFRDAVESDMDAWIPGEDVYLSGMMELRAPGNLVLHSSERGDVLIQTEYLSFGDIHYSHQASFSGYLYPLTGHDCKVLLVATGYGIVGYFGD